MANRDDVIRAARSLIGTRYHHRERQPGVALDCGGVIICVGRALGIFAPDFDVPDYTGTPDGSMLPLCNQHLGRRVNKADMRPGDVIVLVTETAPQHMGIIAENKYGSRTIIHALNDPRYMRVVEQRLVFYRRQRFAAAYSFPGVA